MRILDPAAGRGELLAAARLRASELGVAPQAISGIEIDPTLAAELSSRLGPAVETRVADFMGIDLGTLNPTLVIANPPYGGNRELHFFVKCDREARPGTLLVFLMPISFVDRVPDVTAHVVEGRPLGVTTGHAIVVHRAGEPFSIRPVKGRTTSGPDPEFEVLTGLKVYERGAGTPPQTPELIALRPFTSSKPVEGWLPCLRTGDLDAEGVKPARLWVHYGAHLASPKDLERFSGPRLVLRRMPLWGERRLCAHFLERTELCAGDLLVVKHESDSKSRLLQLADWLRSDHATELIHAHRPSVKHRDSYPKVSAKDINWLIAQWRAATGAA